MPLYVHWILFSFFIIFIFIGCFYLLLYSWKKNTLNEEQKKISVRNCFKSILFYWLIDFFYMSCFNDWLVWKFVFGCLIIVFVFFNLVNAFVVSKKRTNIQKIGLLLDFLLGIGFTIYLLYIIPYPLLQEVMIPIVSAVYGGLITLVGVAWTIKKTEKDRKEDEMKKAEPMFSFSMLYGEAFANNYSKICFSSYELDKNYSCEAFVVIENSIQSSFEMKSIYHDGRKYQLEGNTKMISASPNDKCLLSFRFNSPNDIYLIIEDILGNIYYYQVMVLCNFGKISRDGKYCHTVREIKKVDVSTLEKEIKEGVTYGNRR